MRGGIFLVLLGVFVLAFGLINTKTGIVEIILWIVAIGFVSLGVEGMIRWGFPKGLTSLAAGVLLVLNLLDILKLSFWNFVFSILGVWLIQLGLYSLMGKGRSWDYWINIHRRRF